jgi:hypothetical protein
MFEIFSSSAVRRFIEVTRPQARRRLHIKYNSFGEDKNKLTTEVFTACLRGYTWALVLGSGMSEDENRKRRR